MIPIPFYQGRFQSRPDKIEKAGPCEKDDREGGQRPVVGFPSQMRIFSVQVLRIVNLFFHGSR